MKKITILSLLMAMMFVVSCSTSNENKRSTGKFADRVLKNGTIYTVDEKNPNAQAVAIKNGKIV